MLLFSGLRLPGQTPANGSGAADSGTVFQEVIPARSDSYPLGPDSKPKASNPAGKSFTFTVKNSRIFPETAHAIEVYIPAAYRADKPAAVYVGLDGLSFNARVVFDNLIAQHAMPVTIAIGLPAGSVDSANGKENPRFDRSLEFDSRNDRLARFLLEEVLPAVESHRTPDGLPIKLSTNPNDRAIGGASTGGIGSFTVAWERPDAFRRVFTSIGTFLGMRGGEGYYVEVRKTEPKPLRIFMQDGAYDQWPGGMEIGDWWMSNRTMERALTYAGYEVNHVWGAGTHNGNQASAVFPDAMRWLWKDWPAAIAVPAPGNAVLKAILKPGEAWHVAADGCEAGTAIAANSDGRVFYTSNVAAGITGLAGSAGCFGSKRADGGVSFGPGGRTYTALAGGGIKDSATGKTLAPALHIRSFSVRSNRGIYASAAGSEAMGELWLIHPDGKTTRLDSDIKGATGIALSPDGLWLFAAQSRSRMGLSYRVKPDGTVDAREPFYDFYVPTWADDSGAGSVAMDRDGRAYVATRAGVQVFDRNGRVVAILPVPGNESVSDLCFGGQDFDTLYVTVGKKIFLRKMLVHGVPAWAGPVKLPPWGSG